MRYSAFSSRIRPVLTGNAGAVSAAHPLATAAGQAMLARGGGAVDAMIAAQAVLCVVIPNACGLGGDLLALVRGPDGTATAVNGTGKAPADPRFTAAGDDGTAVTVPGLVGGWAALHERWGKLPLADILAPAIALARDGVRFGPDVMRAVQAQGQRLVAGGAGDWAVLRGAGADTRIRQPELAAVISTIARDGAAAFYRGPTARAVAAAVQARGGYLADSDLAAHETVLRPPLSAAVFGLTLLVQPPVTQGVILAMVARNLHRLGRIEGAALHHAAIEMTAAAFDYRARAAEGPALLEVKLDIDPGRASRRSGPRAYLHTAGVAAADASGQVASSLISVFDDFGSCIFVPEGGFTLNNRAQGFTSAPNDPAPGKRPVHTLAPAIVVSDGQVIGLATPGADGQVQTLLQIVLAIAAGTNLAEAIDAPRWRGENGKLLIEAAHAAADALARLGHDIVRIADGDMRFGGIVCAGFAGGMPIACSDWRREVWSGVA